jgi:hypothetical protein
MTFIDPTSGGRSQNSPQVLFPVCIEPTGRKKIKKGGEEEYYHCSSSEATWGMLSNAMNFQKIRKIQ